VITVRPAPGLAFALLLILSLIPGAMTFAAGGDPVALYKTYSGNIDYVATGNSFRSTNNNCDFFNPMSTSVNLNIPAGANVIEAYLYYAGSADINGQYAGTVIDINDQTNLTLNGVSVPVTPGFNDRNFTNLTGLGSGVVDFFGARRDVSNIVTGPGAYTLAGMVVHRENQGRPPTGTCLGAWGLIVIFEDPNATNVRIINLFEGFKDFKNSTFDLQPRNFVVLDTNPSGKMTHLTFEGDAQITGTENYQLQVGAGGFTTEVNALNPANNQYNSTVTGPDVFDVNTTYGLDIDTYDVSTQLAAQPDAYQAITRYNAGTDLVLLMAEVFATENKALADIEVTLNAVGLFNQNTASGAQYLISVKNNGDGLSSIATGFASGYIHVYDDLPAGIDIDAPSDITAPGWDCSATNFVANQVRCSYNLATLAGSNLDRGDSLPDIAITADVGNITGSVTNRAYVSLCNDSTDSCTTFAEKHTDPFQFDQKNFFEDFQDLFDVQAKSDVNNNVDRVISPIIVGTPSDLSTSTKTVSDLNGGTVDPGDVLQYTITLTETNGVTATGVEITDTIDTDLNSFAYQSTTCGGTAATNFSFGVFTISGLTVPANTSCNVVFQATIIPSAIAGTKIDNTAIIANGNGTGGSAKAPTRLVAGTAQGSKLLYLDNLNLASRELTRDPPISNTSITLTATNQARTMLLNPLLAKDLDVSAGVIPVNVWIQAATTGNYTIRARIRSNTTGDNVLIGEQTLTNVGMTAGLANAQLFPFQINVPTTITNFDAGENIALEILNSNTSAGTITLHSFLQNIDSTVGLAAQDVINVDDISFFSDVARTNEIVTGVDTIEAGQTIYIEATISDPFGFADITAARLTLIDPNLANQLTDVLMTEVGNTTSTKTYVYTYSIPAAASIDPGVWVAQVTGFEGTEGTVTHTDADSFETIGPNVSVDYTVNVLTADANDTLTYTITITNSGAATTLDISQAVPAGTSNLNITSLPSGNSAASNGTTLDIQNINAPNGTTVITFTVDVLGTAQSGDLIDHTISLDNMGIFVTDAAPSVLINPFIAPGGNKTLYADAFGTSGRFDRTVPTSNTTRSISSQGGSRTFTLSPVLQSALTLDPGTIASSLWVSRGASSFAGTRTIEAQLGYTGAASGTIGTQSLTINLAPGTAGAQYIPFNFSLPSTLVLPANTSLTLKVTNNTTVSGETITVHTFKDSTNPSRINLNANTPLVVTAVEFLNASMDASGVVVPSAAPSTTVWVRATVEDPFGRADITGATVSITDPAATSTVTDAVMSIPTTQPASGAQRYFEFSYALTAAPGALGDWTATVTAVEGNEGIVSASNSGVLDVNNDSPDLTDSYKYVTNLTTGNNADTNPGDSLRYTIELVEIGSAAATSVSVTDVIPTNTTYVAGTLKVDGVVQTDPGGTITLTALSVPASGSLTIEFDVVVDGGATVGTVISNSADITNPNGTVTAITVNAEDLIINGVPATGTKFIYLEDLDTGNPFITRAQPQTADANDFIELQNGGGTVAMDLAPALAKDISIDPADGNISVTLRMAASDRNNRNRLVQVDLGYQNGGGVTSIGTASQNVNLQTGNIADYVFTIPVSSLITIPAGNELRLSVTNNQGNNDRDLFLYSHDSGTNRSTIELVPSPVINVDSITFWTDTMGAGTQITNPNPTSDVDVYARIVISDPFGEADIQAFDAATNASTIVITDPDGAVTNGGVNTSCTAPCYAYDGEDITNDVDLATRTFYYLIRINSDPPSTRGTWTVQVTANEGLETSPAPGAISHTFVGNFTTALGANLSTSTKSHNVVGDITNGSQITYTITLNNSGGQDADNVTITDTLQTTPVNLSFVSAATTCTDEAASALPNPTFSGGAVSLSNISVTAGSNCTVVVTVQVGAGSPGDLIDNSVTIINPGGVGGSPAAPTLLYEASQVPTAGSKQLYLDNVSSGTPDLTRTQPTATSQIIINEGGDSVTLTLDNVTTREMILSAGAIDVNLLLSETGKGSTRQTFVELFVDPNDGGGYQSIDSEQLNLTLSGTPGIKTFNLNNPSNLTLNAGSSFRIVVQNNQGNNNRVVILDQSTSAPFSELVVPLINSIEVTEVKFFDASATDTGAGAAGCETTFSCGTEIDPGLVISGNTIWARTIISDGFGAFDVNTGCDGVTATNCPTITVSDPNTNSIQSDLVFVNEPDTSSRRYEYEINPSGFGLEGTWQVTVLGKEGVEDVISDTGVNTFQRYSLPTVTIVKSASGTYLPGQFATYSNTVNNTGDGPAFTLEVINTIGDFISIELIDNGGTWSALDSLSGGYTVLEEKFDDGNGLFDYNPDVEGVCALPAAAPCYDPAIEEWSIKLNETFPAGDSFIQQYRVKVD
jgi:uncharacterized repeat protein (TIGR01451 family)/fimbrial isopeptide formation D2 family protein